MSHIQDSVLGFLSSGLVNGLAVGLAACLGVFVVRMLYLASNGPLASLPGSTISRYTDLPVRLRVFTGDRAQYIQALHLKYGPVVRLGPSETDIADLDAVREIHRVRDPFIKTSFYGPPNSRYQSMFSTADPAFHSKRRRLLGSYFSEASLVRMEPMVTEVVRAAVQGIVDESRREGSVDILKWWTLMAMDIISTMSFGETFGMVKGEKKTQFADDVASLGATLPMRTSFPTLLTICTYLPFFPKYSNIGKIRQRVLAEGVKRSTRFLELLEKDDSKRSKSIFGALCRKEGEATEDFSKMDLVIETQSFITAGTDTTAVTLTYLIWSVCRDKDLQRALVEELQPLEEPLTNTVLRDLPLLNRVVDETLRVYGASQGALPRYVPHGGLSVADYFIPPNVTVSTQVYNLNRNPDIFPEPAKFDVTRWEKPTEQMTQAFMPFGIGPRGCVGAQLARMELRLASAMFFRTAPQAKVSMKDGFSDAEMEPEISFLLMPAGHRCLIEV